MGNLLGEMRPLHGRSARLRALALWSLPLVIVACGGDDGDSLADTPTTASTEAAAETGLQPCAEDRHLVAVDIIGLLTVENVEIVGPWVDNGIEPTPRPGAVEVMQAYRERGYEVRYITSVAPNVPGREQVEGVAMAWLQRHGFPTAGLRLWVWEGVQREDGRTWIAMADELLRLAAYGVSVDAAYSENPDKLYAFITGGVPQERNFSITPVEGLGDAAPNVTPTTPIPNDDLVAHAATVRELPPVCQVD
jgi:hypothetical protein